jgi:hypothetical protein
MMLQTSSSASQVSTNGDRTPSTVTEGDGEERVDRRKKQRSAIWKHFTLSSKYGDGEYGLFRCHGCGDEEMAASLKSNINLWTHAKQACPKVLALVKGVTVDQFDNTQSRLGGFNVVIPPFTKQRFDIKLVNWIASAGLPFTTVESAPF